MEVKQIDSLCFGVDHLSSSAYVSGYLLIAVLFSLVLSEMSFRCI